MVPELASRDHVRRTVPLIERVLADAGLALERPRRGRLHRRARASRARCWSARASPARWLCAAHSRRAGPSPRRPPAVAAARDAAARVSVRRAAGVGRAQPALRRRAASASTGCSAIRRTMPRAKRSTRRPSSWACPIPAAPRLRASPSRARAGAVRLPRPMLDVGQSRLQLLRAQDRGADARAQGSGRRGARDAPRIAQGGHRARDPVCDRRRARRQVTRRAASDGTRRGWSWPAAWARIARCASGSSRRARGAGVLPRPRVLHRQRRDDRARRRHAPGARRLGPPRVRGAPALGVSRHSTSTEAPARVA